MKVINQDTFQIDWWKHVTGGVQKEGEVSAISQMLAKDILSSLGQGNLGLYLYIP